MIPNGVYVRCGLEFIAAELTENLTGLKRLDDAGNQASHSPASMRRVAVFLYPWKDGWCRVQITGDREGAGLVAEFLIGRKSIEEALVWDCSDESVSYNYSYFSGGKLLEQLSVTGPALGAVNFKSELRQIRLQDLINGRDFAEETLERFGISGKEGAEGETAVARLDFSLPAKRPLLKSLLGTLAGSE